MEIIVKKIAGGQQEKNKASTKNVALLTKLDGPGLVGHPAESGKLQFAMNMSGYLKILKRHVWRGSKLK